MIETIAAIAKEALKKESALGSEIKETISKETKTPLENSLSIIEEKSLESLKTQNELLFENDLNSEELIIKSIQDCKESYMNDVIEKSDIPETIDKEYFLSQDCKPISVEETIQKREEFEKLKPELKQKWEQENGLSWPKYKEDIYSENNIIIRRAGNDYDAHHIQPLSMGGKNEASNITPLHANIHYDKQGIHSPDSPYSQLKNLIGA